MSNDKPIRRIAIIGTGVIGASWTALFLAKGLDVVATDVAPDAETALRRFVKAAWPALERLGLVPGANIGEKGAVFEAVHGSAPDIAGKGIANPTALLQSAILMLNHIEERSAAEKIEKALLKVFEEGKVRTRDIGGSATTNEFADAVIGKMNQ